MRASLLFCVRVLSKAAGKPLDQSQPSDVFHVSQEWACLSVPALLPLRKRGGGFQSPELGLLVY